MTGPDGSSGPVMVRIPDGSNVCHRGCAYTVLQTVQIPGVCKPFCVEIRQPVVERHKIVQAKLADRS